MTQELSRNNPLLISWLFRQNLLVLLVTLIHIRDESLQTFPSLLESIKDLGQEQVFQLIKKALRFRSAHLKPLSLNTMPRYQSNFSLATLFHEDSTRTKISFQKAALNLGLSIIDINPKTSSLTKGETLEETLKTLKYLGIDILVYRTNLEKQYNAFKTAPPLCLINGGDGINEHPTQALLDVMTFISDGHDLKNSTMALIGDLAHSRVANSLIQLAVMVGLKVILVSPKGNEPADDIKKLAFAHTHDLDQALAQSDFVYTLRVQKERHKVVSQNFQDYSSNYGLNLNTFKKLGRNLCVYHPGPVNIGNELSYDLMKGPYYRGHAQVQNGIFIRMAVIDSMIENLRPHKFETPFLAKGFNHEETSSDPIL